MLLFFKSLPRLVRSANKDMHRHFSMTFSSIVSIGIALLMALFIFVIYMNVGGFTSQIENEFMIQVSLNPEGQAAEGALRPLRPFECCLPASRRRLRRSIDGAERLIVVS